MVRHDNVHRIEWPLGVITAVYPDASGIIRTAEVEECGKRSLCPISYLVPLELDCRHDDDALHLRPREREGNEEEDADDNEEDDASINEDSITDLNNGSLVSDDTEGQRFFPDVTLEESLPMSADAEGQRFLPDASEHHMSGSSRESGLAIGINDGCNVSATPNVVPESHTPTTVSTQAREGVERDEGDAMSTARPQRRAARQQRALLGRLTKDDLL